MTYSPDAPLYDMTVTLRRKSPRPRDLIKLIPNSDTVHYRLKYEGEDDVSYFREHNFVPGADGDISVPVNDDTNIQEKDTLTIFKASDKICIHTEDYIFGDERSPGSVDPSTKMDLSDNFIQIPHSGTLGGEAYTLPIGSRSNDFIGFSIYLKITNGSSTTWVRYNITDSAYHTGDDEVYIYWNSRLAYDATWAPTGDYYLTANNDQLTDFMVYRGKLNAVSMQNPTGNNVYSTFNYIMITDEVMLDD